jgi:ankyrin repeat protein
MACKKNQLDVVQELLNTEGIDPCHANSMGISALHIAAWWARADIMLFLLQRRANVHAANRFTGATPLHGCLQSSKAALYISQRLRCIDLLLEYGADPLCLDALGRTPLDYMDPEDIDAKAILEHFQPQKPTLFKLLQKGKGKTTTTLEDVQAFLLEHEHPSNVVNASHQDSTPLLQVVHEWCDVEVDEDAKESSVLSQNKEDDDYYPKVIQVLIDAGADVTATNQGDHSSVDLLCTAILQRYKQRVKNNSTVLDEDPLVQSWKTAVSQLLKKQQRQQTVEISDNQHTIPPPQTTMTMTMTTTAAQDAWLEIARRNYLDVAHLWWDDFQISPVGVVNRQGMTPLQFAARSGHLEMVVFLLQIATTVGNKNMMLEHQDQRGQTAQQAAETNHYPGVVRLLLNHHHC